MKTTIFTCITALTTFIVACSDTSTTPTAPKQPSYYCNINGITYQNVSAYITGCVTPTQSFYCNLNGVTYQSEAAYISGCVAPTYYCSLNGVTYTDLNQYNTYCVQQYCCERTGQCYNSKAIYDIQCSTPPSNSDGNNNGTNCTTCDCNSIFQSTYKSMSNTAACASAPEQCKATVAKQVGCKL